MPVSPARRPAGSTNQDDRRRYADNSFRINDNIFFRINDNILFRINDNIAPTTGAFICSKHAGRCDCEVLSQRRHVGPAATGMGLPAVT